MSTEHDDRWDDVPRTGPYGKVAREREIDSKEAPFFRQLTPDDQSRVNRVSRGERASDIVECDGQLHLIEHDPTGFEVDGVVYCYTVRTIPAPQPHAPVREFEPALAPARMEPQLAAHRHPAAALLLVGALCFAAGAGGMHVLDRSRTTILDASRTVPQLVANKTRVAEPQTKSRPTVRTRGALHERATISERTDHSVVSQSVEARRHASARAARPTPPAAVFGPFLPSVAPGARKDADSPDAAPGKPAGGKPAAGANSAAPGVAAPAKPAGAPGRPDSTDARGKNADTSGNGGTVGS